MNKDNLNPLDDLLASKSLESVTFKREQLIAYIERKVKQKKKARKDSKKKFIGTEDLLKQLRENFTYDPSTGKFFQHHSEKSGFIPGQEVGAKNRGYRRLCVGGKLVRAHIAAWAMHYGVWPSGQIDHENRNKADNRIENLRIATKSQNQANVVKPNATGRKGVKMCRGKPQAQIKLNGKHIHLGTFDTLDEAAHAYNKAAIRLHGEFAVLNPIGRDYE